MTARNNRAADVVCTATQFRPAHRGDFRSARLAVALALVGIYLPVVILPYAYSDDYPLLWMAISDEPNAWFGSDVLEVPFSGGRPLMGLLLQVAFSSAGGIDNLRFVRLVSLIGLLVLALLLHGALARSGFRPAAAALTAVFVCSMPPFQVTTSWATLFAAPFGAVLGGMASLAIDPTRSSPPYWRTGRFAVSTVLFVTSLLVYQPAAMFFFVIFAVTLVGVARDAARTAALIRAHALTALAALPVAFALGKLAARFVSSSAPGTNRAVLTYDLIGKAEWFFTHALYRSLNLCSLTSGPWLAATVLVLAVAGTALWLRSHAARPLRCGLILLCLVPLSFLPSLLAAENNSYVFRTGIAMTSLVAFYCCLGSMGVWSAVRARLDPHLGGGARRKVRRLGLAMGVVAVSVSGCLAARNVLALVALPQSVELRLIRSHVAALPDATERLGYVQINWGQGMTPWYSDEIGLASSARPWTGNPAVLLILHETGRIAPGGRRPIVETIPWDATALPGSEPIIDLRTELARLRAER